MKKRTSKVFCKNVYLLGEDKEGTKYWLEESKFECGWYWGVGYVETYTNNSNDPSTSRDIKSHSHFDSMFFNTKKNGHDAFVDFFSDTTLTNEEIWKLLELMKTLYAMREYSDIMYRGNSNYTTNPQSEVIRSSREYERINKVVIPALLQEVYTLLSPK